MNKYVKKLFFIIPILLLMAYSSISGVTDTISYQGRLLNNDSTAVTGSVQIVFSIYTVASGGSPVWTETYSGVNEVSVTNGYYSVSLGSQTALTSTVFSSDTTYLGIKVESDPEMAPRIKFETSPYSYNADKLDSYDSSYFLNADNLASGTVPNARLDADLIDLSDGTLSAAKLESTVMLQGENISLLNNDAGYVQASNAAINAGNSGNFSASQANTSLKIGVDGGINSSGFNNSYGNISIGNYQIYTDGNESYVSSAKQGLVIQTQDNPSSHGAYTLLSVQSSGEVNRFSVIHGAAGYTSQFYDSLSIGSGSTSAANISNVYVNFGITGDSDLWVADDIELGGNIYQKAAGSNYFGANIGIGTTTPAYALDIARTDPVIKLRSTATGQTGIRLHAGSGATNRATRIDFYNEVASDTVPRWTLSNDYSQAGDNDFSFIDSNDVKRLVILQGGNVGVGTTSPGKKLEVKSSDEIVAQFLYNGASNGGLLVENAGTNGAGYLSLSGMETGSTQKRIAYIAAVGAPDNADVYDTDMVFKVRENNNSLYTTTKEVLRLKHNGHVILSGGAIYIDNDNNPGGFNDDWLYLNGYLGVRGNNDYSGMRVFDKDTNSFLSLTQIGGDSYLTDTGSATSYFLKGSGANADVRGTLTANLFSGNGASLTNVDADKVDGYHASSFLDMEWVRSFSDNVANTGTWTQASSGWGEPSISADYYYTLTSGQAVGSETVDFNIPAGAKTACISFLSHTTSGYFDVFIKISGNWRWHRRINAYSIYSGNSSRIFDGNNIAVAATGLDHATQIRIRNQKGRIFFTGIGFTREDMRATGGSSFMHWDNILALPALVIQGDNLNLSDTLTITGSPGDNPSVITSRLVPAGQGADTEKTELILFHSNDVYSPDGPDLITLRAPSIRLQTYDNSLVDDIDDDLGSNTRLNIDPQGNVQFSGPYIRNYEGSNIFQTDKNDWLRVMQKGGWSEGMAVYGSVAINSGGGLAVGEWSSQPEGIIKATEGFIDDENSAKLKGNSVSDYGAWEISGTRGGWSGINYNNAVTLMMKSNQIGFYNDANNEWMLQTLNNAGVYLYYDRYMKFETRDDGVDIWGHQHVRGYRQWELFYMRDFEGETVLQFGGNSYGGCHTDIGFNRILGGRGTPSFFASHSTGVYLEFDSGENFVQGRYSMVKVKVNYYFIDSWDGEMGMIDVRLKNGSSWSGLYRFWQSPKVTHAGTQYSFTGSSHSDAMIPVEFVIPIESNTNIIRIQFFSDLDGNTNDEAWGIDNIELYGR